MEEEPLLHAGETGARRLERAIGLLEVEGCDRARVGISASEKQIGPALPVHVGDGGGTLLHASETGPRGLKRAIGLLEVERRDRARVGIIAGDEEVGPASARPRRRWKRNPSLRR